MSSAVREFMTRLFRESLGENGPERALAIAESLYGHQLDSMSRLQQDWLKIFEAFERDFADERQRLQVRSKENPASVGSFGEKCWKRFLEEVLPTQYKVVQTAHISQGDEESVQLDLLILKPGQSRLVEEGNYFPPNSVLAGFECKLTLTLADLKATIKKGCKLKRFYPSRVGTLEDELSSQFTYGLLGMGHGLHHQKKPAAESIYAALQEESLKVVRHPRELLDLVVVPGALCFNAYRGLDIFDSSRGEWGYERVECDVPFTAPENNALGTFFACLLRRMSNDRPDLAGVLEMFSFFGSGSRVTSVFASRPTEGLLSQQLIQQIAHQERRPGGASRSENTAASG